MLEPIHIDPCSKVTYSFRHHYRQSKL